MSEQLNQTRHQPLAIFGKDTQIQALVQRMRYMIPGAQDAPDATVWKAAQIAHIHKLDPFSGDIQVYSIYKDPGEDVSKWIVNVGISAWRRAAQRQAKYTHTIRPLTSEEIQAINRNYTPQDIGAECTLYRLDVAAIAKQLGVPYTPTIATGLWRGNAYQDKAGKWHPDQLPNTSTAKDVAERRAEKKALKICFSLDFPDDEAQAPEWRVVEDIERPVQREAMHRAMPAERNPTREPDGDLLWS